MTSVEDWKIDRMTHNGTTGGGGQTLLKGGRVKSFKKTGKRWPKTRASSGGLNQDGDLQSTERVQDWVSFSK